MQILVRRGLVSLHPAAYALNDYQLTEQGMTFLINNSLLGKESGVSSMEEVKFSTRWHLLFSNLRWFWVDTMYYYNCDGLFLRPVTMWQKVKVFAHAVKLNVRDLLFEDALCRLIKVEPIKKEPLS